MIPNKQLIFKTYMIKSKNPGPFYHFSKRTMDIIGASLGLVITSPLWVIVYALVKMDSSGPVLFKQKRVGHQQKHFDMYKFRTMAEISDNPSPSSDSDRRITRIGKFLRKYSIDELPQFINILKGEMSLVGPRPEMIFVVDNYQDWQRDRFKVKPGVSGLWQIMGRKDLPLVDNIELDIYYLNNRSILLDLIILVNTPFVVVKGKGAY